MMTWIGMGVLGVLLCVVGMLFVIVPGVRQFCWGAIGGLGVAGVLLFVVQPSTTPARGTGKETAVSWVPRVSRPGSPGVSTAPVQPEAVSTPEEAAQAVQRLRAAQDVQQATEEPPVFAGPPAHVRPPAETLAPPLAAPVPPPLRSATLATEEDHDTVTRGAVPPLSAPTLGGALKSCEVLKAEIQAKLAAKGLSGYVLTITTSGDVQGPEIVGRCEGNTRKIVLYRTRNAL